MDNNTINNNDSITLSIIIICHNQKNEVKRCIESVLQQKTSFAKEIIVSDDRSTDGTREMLVGEYKDKVISTFFNSDECNVSLTMERSGYNRLNGLKLARGKYIIHTDGDDFFTSTDLFQTMVDTLEEHPDCTMCCQNFCVVKSDNINAPHIPSNTSELLKKDCVVSAQTFFSSVKMLVNACFCSRKGDNFNAEHLWGGTYDDSYITARYVGNGNIAILNRCDFVYVQYNHSTCATMKMEDKKILFQTAIGIVELTPSIAGAMMKKYTLSFFRLSKHVVLLRPISKEILSFCGKFDNFMYHNLSRVSSFKVWIRYFFIFMLSGFMSITKIKTRNLLTLLYKTAIGEVSSDVII